ncbi:hypothetical protein LOD99_13591 [Oopsacas minuta]|uniref:Ion transport domain-containing protein n=1 Tax=Oopsacas minuta TaxID=111878 RepID=A0AAV7KHN1_9METZ|nr:hypothetical protein LOD99_13591 [Oopsacas minuta]
MVDHVPSNLVTACRLGKEAEVLELIASDQDVNQRDKSGYMGLHWAAFHGHYACVVALLKAKDRIDINAIDNGGGTPLMKASFKGQTPIVKLLLDNGANENMKDNKGMLAVHFASEKGHDECIVLLTADRKNINESSNPLMITPLYKAVLNNEEAACRTLIDIGADVNCIDSNQKTPLMISCSKGHVQIARLLLDKNAHLNARDSRRMTALHYACQWGHPDCVELLVNSINTYQNSNISVMDTASEEEELRYAPIHYSAGGKTRPGEVFSEEDQEKYCRCVEILVENGSEVQPLATKFVTPLHIASDVGNTAVVKFLLQRGANPNAENLVGESPLHYALKRKYNSVIALLVTHGASLYANSYDGVAPTQLMGLEDIIGIVFHDVLSGSIVEEDERGYNILHYVCKWGQLEWVDRFLDDCNEEEKLTKLFKNSDNNPESFSPFIICVRSGNDELAAAMLKHYFIGQNTRALEVLESEDYYGKNVLHLIAEMKCYKTLETVLDLLVHEADDNKLTLLPDLLNINEQGQKPPLLAYTDEVTNYSRASPTLYHKLNYLNRNELTFHPVVSMLTEKKISVYGKWYFLSLLGFLLYLLFIYIMLYTLVSEPSSSPGSSPGLTIMYLLVLLCLIIDIVCECAEFFTITYRYFKKMPSIECMEPAKIRVSGQKAGTDIELYTWMDAMEKAKKFHYYFSIISFISSPSIFKGFFQLSRHIFREYVLDILNLLDLLGIFFIFLFFVLHFAQSDSQWIVASLAYLFNTLRIGKYLRLFIYTGPYLYTMFRGLITDFPKFILFFLIMLSAFTGAFTLSSRGQFNRSQLCPPNPEFEDGTLCDGLTIFIHGIRVLLAQGEVFQNPEYFIILGFYLTLISAIFVILTVIFLQNILIAAFTKTYEDTLQSPQQYKFKIVVEFETKSLLFILFGKIIQPLTTILKAKVSKDYWSRYLVLETLLNTRKTEEMVYDLSQHVDKLEKQSNEIKKSLLAIQGGKPQIVKDDQ